MKYFFLFTVTVVNSLSCSNLGLLQLIELYILSQDTITLLYSSVHPDNLSYPPSSLHIKSLSYLLFLSHAPYFYFLQLTYNSQLCFSSSPSLSSSFFTSRSISISASLFLPLASTTFFPFTFSQRWSCALFSSG